MAHGKRQAKLPAGRVWMLAGWLVLCWEATSIQAGVPSEEYRAGLRRTIELRRQRRLNARPQPLGVIVPYPMPPSLIIRQTPEAHGEIRDVLTGLRR